MQQGTCRIGGRGCRDGLVEHRYVISFAPLFARHLHSPPPGPKTQLNTQEPTLTSDYLRRKSLYSCSLQTCSAFVLYEVCLVVGWRCLSQSAQVTLPRLPTRTSLHPRQRNTSEPGTTYILRHFPCNSSRIVALVFLSSGSAHSSDAVAIKHPPPAAHVASSSVMVSVAYDLSQ